MKTFFYKQFPTKNRGLFSYIRFYVMIHLFYNYLSNKQRKILWKHTENFPNIDKRNIGSFWLCEKIILYFHVYVLETE